MLTAYQLHTVANVKLVELGLKEIPSQMVYNYIRQGMIPAVDATGTHKPYAELKGSPYFVTIEDAKVWLNKFLAKKQGTSNTVAELMRKFSE